MKLGKMEKIQDLRSVWKNEPRNFSKWLAEEDNLELLSREIGIDICLEQLESKVGDFSVDLLAKERNTKRKIVIENQLEDTDHNHLGKIITYASGKDAEIIIWIVKKAREEHRKAIEWLNDKTPSDIAFFLVEIELWKIEDSPIAPHFNVVERPNDWAKTIKESEGLTNTKKLQFEIWKEFCDYAFDNDLFSSAFTRRKPAPQHWQTLGISGKSYEMNVSMDTQKKQIYVDVYFHDDKKFYFEIKNHKDEFEKKFGSKLEWVEANKDCRIVAKNKGDFKDVSNKNWKSLFDWFIDNSLKLKSVMLEIEKNL